MLKITSRSAFTLVELLVSTALIGLILLMMVSTVDQTSKIWKTTQAKVSQFQSARVAFESLTRNLSQATLNTFWESYDNPKTNAVDYKYVRQSDLHYVSGKAWQSKFLADRKAPTRTGSGVTITSSSGAPGIHPTHALFFQAPLGRTSKEAGGARVYRALPNLLSAVGYFVEWGDDPTTPAPILDSVPPKYRFRLMEMDQPAETLSIFSKQTSTKKGDPFMAADWIQVGLGLKSPITPGSAGSKISDTTVSAANVRVMADNVVALVILPKLSERDRTNVDVLDLAPDYEYDTRPSAAGGLTKSRDTYIPLETRQSNQLPPLVHVVLVAIDEASAFRQQEVTKQNPPDYTNDKSLFRTVNNDKNLKDDIVSLTNVLAPKDSKSLKLNYRIFEADVVIRGAKWSQY